MSKPKTQYERDYEAFVEGVLPPPNEDLAIRRKAIEEEIPTLYDRPEDIPPRTFTIIGEEDDPADISDVDDWDDL